MRYLISSRTLSLSCSVEMSLAHLSHLSSTRHFTFLLVSTYTPQLISTTRYPYINPTKVSFFSFSVSFGNEDILKKKKF